LPCDPLAFADSNTEMYDTVHLLLRSCDKEQNVPHQPSGGLVK